MEPSLLIIAPGVPCDCSSPPNGATDEAAQTRQPSSNLSTQISHVSDHVCTTGTQSRFCSCGWPALANCPWQARDSREYYPSSKQLTAGVTTRAVSTDEGRLLDHSSNRLIEGF